MRIISQDRSRSTDFDRCDIVIQGNIIFREKGECDKQVIGVYSTPERAAEVFEDMHKAYAPVYSISNNLTADEIKDMLLPSNNVQAHNILNAGYDMCLTTFDDYVYCMPEE